MIIKNKKAKDNNKTAKALTRIQNLSPLAFLSTLRFTIVNYRGLTFVNYRGFK